MKMGLERGPEDMRDDEQEGVQDQTGSSHASHALGWREQHEPKHSHAKQPSQFEEDRTSRVPQAKDGRRQRSSYHEIERIVIDRRTHHGGSSSSLGQMHGGIGVWDARQRSQNDASNQRLRKVPDLGQGQCRLHEFDTGKDNDDESTRSKPDHPPRVHSLLAYVFFFVNLVSHLGKHVRETAWQGQAIDLAWTKPHQDHIGDEQHGEQDESESRHKPPPRSRAATSTSVNTATLPSSTRP